jgi:Flp pilus assembly protein TadD
VPGGIASDPQTELSGAEVVPPGRGPSKPNGSRFWLPVVLLISGLAVVFIPHLDNGFVYDDHAQIEQNPWLVGDGSWTEAFRGDVWSEIGDGSGSHLKYYRPIFTTMNRIAYRAGNGSSRTFHVTSLGFHVISLALVGVVLTLLGFDRRQAFAAACLFAFHPLVGDVVFWAGCLSEQLMLVGFLAAFALTLWARRFEGSKRVTLTGIAVICAAFALLAKETSLVIAPLLTIEAFCSPRSTRRSRLLDTLPFWVLTAGFLVLRVAVLDSSGFGRLYPDLVWSITRTGYVLLWDIRRLVFPIPLTLFHDLPMGAGSLFPALAGGTTLLAICFGVIWWSAKKHRSFFWAAWILLPLLPPLTQLFFTLQTGLIVADRYLLMSLVPWCAVVVVAFNELISRFVPGPLQKRLAVLFLGGACFSGGMILHGYGQAFENDASVFERAAKYAPGSPTVSSWLAKLSMDEDNYEEAIPLLIRAIETEPSRLQHRLNLGIALTRSGRPQEAALAFEAALKIDPDFADSHQLLGEAYRDVGRLSDAARHWEIALRLDPDSVPARVNLGTYLYLQNEIAESITLWESALAVSPEHMDLLFNLGMAHRRIGDHQRSAVYLRRFLAIAGDSYRAQRETAQSWLAENLGTP